MNRHPKTIRRSISNEALVEGLQNADGLSTDDEAFVAECATELESKEWLEQPIRDRLIRLGKVHGVLRKEDAQKRPRISSFRQDMANGVAAYAKLLDQAQAALANRPPVRRAG